MRALLLFITFLGSASLCVAQEKQSVIRVNVTTQGWDFLRPWSKKAPVTRRAIGTVLAGPRVLVTAELVANATYLELETTQGGKKVPASIDFVDYEANLALLKTDDPAFLADFPAMEITQSRIGEEVSVYQLENSGRPLYTKGPVTTAEFLPYPIDGAFLIYRVTVPLQTRDNSFTMPVVRDGKLTGILMSYDNQSDNANVVPAPVIEHFIKDLSDGTYDGFPRAGFSFSPLRDPELRRYCKLPDDTVGGIYVTGLIKGGAMEKAGLKEGDVIFKIEDLSVDQDGNYLDPIYGKIPIGHVFSVKHFTGETVKAEISRGGEKTTLDVELSRPKLENLVSEPYIIDRAPRFIVEGGLVFQELSRQYLKDIGVEWQGRTPDRLAYFDRFQNELFPGAPEKVVFLSSVLPTPATVGYEDLNHLVVKMVNDVPVKSLGDLAAALEKPINGFHKIRFIEDPNTIYLDAAEARKNEPLLKQRYHLPLLKRLE